LHALPDGAAGEAKRPRPTPASTLIASCTSSTTRAISHLRIEPANAEKQVENIQQVLDNPAPTADDLRRAFGISQKPLTLVGHLPLLPAEPEKP
jgi:hypothetical protein